MELLLLAIFLPLFLLFIRKKYKQNRLQTGLPPGPPGLPLIGNMHQWDAANTHIYLQKLSQKYGPHMSLQLGSIKYLIISSASAAREVFKYHDVCFSGRPTLVGAQKLAYNGVDIVFASYNEYWRETRKITTLHLFSSRRSQSFQPIREREVARMVKTIRDGAAASADAVDLSETLMTVTSSIIFKITFGRILEGEDDNMSGKMKSFHWLLTASTEIISIFFAADYFPVMGHLIDRLSGATSGADKKIRVIDAFYQQIIDDYIRTSPESTQDCSILDTLLQIRKESPDFTMDNVKAILADVLVAGAETSAVAVIWAMTLLMKNPAKMKRIQEEVREIVGKKGFVDENDVQKLVYLKAVVKEAMRLHPPAPLLLPHETVEECVISGYKIEAKTRVFVNIYAIGRDPESYENPDEFLPERFLNGSIDFKGHHFELLTFGTGRRMCPGLSLGVATTELALANLLYSFNWELPPGKKREDIDMDSMPGLIVQKKNHLCLVPENINL